MVTEAQLEKFANDFLLEYFNIPLKIPIVRNNRLRTSLGRFVTRHDGTALKIELAGKVFRYGSEAHIYGIVKHECIHYVFHLQGKKYTDGDEPFEAALRKYNAPSTNTLKIGEYYTYRCNKCQKVGETALKSIVQKPTNYRTNCCHAKLSVIGSRIYH